MSNMKKLVGCYVAGFLCSMCWHLPVHAAQAFSVAQTAPVPAEFDMASTSTGTFRVTNNSTTPNLTDRITAVRFRLPSTTGSTFAVVQPPSPANWTCTRTATRTVNCTSTYANGIPSLGFVDFALSIVLRTNTTDISERFRDVRPTYTTSGGTSTNGTTGNIASPGWSIKALVVTLTPSSTSVSRNCNFDLTMQVTNKSTSNISGVVSVPKPPTLVATGGATATTASNPANLTLNAGASGSFLWTYNTGNTAGTLTLSASARDSASTRTSRTITAAVITVSTGSCLVVSFNAPSPTCIFSGDTVTFTMHVVNATGGSLTTVQPSALTPGGTATFGSFSAPSPASVATLANGASQDFVWTVPISGNVFTTYTVSGFATASGGVQSQPASSASADINGFTLDASPDVNAFSTRQEMTWSIVNHGCNVVSSVTIPIVAGWTFSGDLVNDAYSLVQIGGGNVVESWTPSVSGSNVVFTYPGAGSEMAVDAPTSEFRLILTTPSVTSTTTYNFGATVTDIGPPVRTRTISDPNVVTTNVFGSGGTTGPNNTSPGTWREIFQ